MKISAIVVFGALVCLGANGQEIPAKEFFGSIHGSYRILSAGGKVPSPDGNTADVSEEGTETFFTMPYCLPDGGCDPGYTFFEHASVRVEMIPQENGQAQYQIQTPEGLYTWDMGVADATFTNYQFLIQGEPVTMVHVLERR